jgi:hypothetical protein
MSKKVLVAVFVAACSVFAPVGVLPASAASPTISISNPNGLLDGQLVSVEGTGFSTTNGTAEYGMETPVFAVECSNVPGQPTVNSGFGFALPVSCDFPTNESEYPFGNSIWQWLDSNGNVESIPFVVHTGIVGPPGLGIDSAAHNAAADAALYPCPPTPSQQAGGASCELTLIDGNGVSASAPINFGIPVHPSPALFVASSDGLSTGDEVTIHGTGFTPDSPWLAVECNVTPGEPTGSYWDPNLPISCDPANAVPSAANGGIGPGGPTFPASSVTDPSGAVTTNLMIQEGNIGEAEDTSAYPCPPSHANLAAGGSCAVVVEDGAGHQAMFELGITGPVPVPTITVSPSAGLTTGSTVQVTGVNFIPNELAGVVECNGAQGEPTVSYDGLQVPVSCSIPQTVETTSTGTLSAGFHILEGVVGPPSEGTDSAGNPASVDAAAYPCPPTAAQQTDGVTCGIGVGDLAGELAEAQISFETPTSPPSCTESGDARFVCALYSDLLKRAPDAGGLAYWEAQLAGGTSQSQVVLDMLTSAEYRNALVENYYKTFLGRAADPGGLSFFDGELSQGASDQSVMEGILGSPEFYADSGGTPGGFVNALYEHLLGRSPDAAGLSYWEDQLAGGADGGAVAGGILSSAEYQADFVRAQYTFLLKRDADPAGLSYWEDQLAGGASYESVIAGIAGSTEYYDLHNQSNPPLS